MAKGGNAPSEFKPIKLEMSVIEDFPEDDDR